jgi:hypothetical protein
VETDVIDLTKAPTIDEHNSLPPVSVNTSHSWSGRTLKNAEALICNRMCKKMENKVDWLHELKKAGTEEFSGKKAGQKGRKLPRGLEKGRKKCRTKITNRYPGVGACEFIIF